MNSVDISTLKQVLERRSASIEFDSSFDISLKPKNEESSLNKIAIVDDFTTSELQDIARYYQIPGRSKINRISLIQRICEMENETLSIQQWHQLKKKYFPPVSSKIKFVPFSHPHSINDLMISFKKKYTAKELQRYWAWMNGGTTFTNIIELDQKNFDDLLPKIQESGLIVDYLGVAGIIISPEGLEFLNLRDAFNQNPTRLFKFTGTQLRKYLLKAVEDEISLENLTFNAIALETLSQNLKRSRDPREDAEYSIATVIPQNEGDIHWPLLIRNNYSGMLGSLAPKTPINEL